ncbi:MULTISPECIES: ATP-binding protein [Paraburkholderia]|uniref:ATP-binding protein n=1 Tax=Paraburkholderia TaxID=1822464 RepID=UPI0022585D2E|nr:MULTISPECIES: ATP-binding protein [Paraburkholderia]MCX4159656.1 ATP-binding protein [Paraburkholderia aspalathi]MDN7169054.1 ATP-binding protein [Paraburkholderia sp. SECH2]MDQ6397541.1 ATP-binding protein [Paraburkholderia aspalathi]
MLARNIALLVVLVILSQIFTLGTLAYFVQGPRIEHAAQAFATYIKEIDKLVTTLPLEESSIVTSRIEEEAKSADKVTLVNQDLHFDFYRRYQHRIFSTELLRQLPPDMLVRWDSDMQHSLLIGMNIAGAPTWIRMPIPQDPESTTITAAALLSLGLGILAAVAGYLIQRRLNTPLQELAHAAAQISNGRRPTPLPTDGPAEIARVSESFNQMAESLKRAEATRMLMLAGISHDIRTPLTKMRLAIAMSDSANADRAFVSSTDEYLNQVDEIVQQFLDYSGSGEREASVPGDLNVLVKRLAADFCGLGHNFTLSLEQLPDVSFRPVAMFRMLMNLMHNAVEYGRVGLHVQTLSDDHSAFVVVSDRGTTISGEELECLKYPFHRGSNSGTRVGGTGLGLAIAERIAKLHGGSLQYRTREGGGISVWVQLPLQAVAGLDEWVPHKEAVDHC